MKGVREVRDSAKIFRKKLTIEKMDNKLLENCIMSEELRVEKCFFCEDKGVICNKESRSRLFMKDNDDDESPQRG